MKDQPLLTGGFDRLSAEITDPDGWQGLSGRIELWNESNPAERLAREA